MAMAIFHLDLVVLVRFQSDSLLSGLLLAIFIVELPDVN